MGLLRRFVDWVTYDYNKIDSRAVYEIEEQSGKFAVVGFYIVLIEQHKETGEYRLQKVQRINSQLVEYDPDKEALPIIATKRKFMGRTTADLDVIEFGELKKIYQ